MSLRSDSSARSPGVGRSQIHSLTALRGIAAWWVVLFHFETYLKPYVSEPVFRLVDKGYLAVDLFFCLSGFVIFLNYWQIDVTKWRELYVFYFKRLAKIYPLHLFTIGLYLALVGVLLLTHRDVEISRFSGSSLALNLFLIQAWVGSSYLTWNIPSWSVSTEFAAYLSFPLVVCIARLVGSRIAISVVVIILLVCLLNVFYASVDFDLGRAIGSFGVLRCVVEFAIGALLAQLFLAKPMKHSAISPALFIISGVFLFLGLNQFNSMMIPLAWAMLVFALARVGRSEHCRYGWLVFLGEISYATYMLHYFVRDVFKLALVHAGKTTPLYCVLAAFVVILVGSLPLYFWVERPAQWGLVTRAFAKRQPG